ncbi:hypothetical protein AC579_6902 [Pseudocercospora musae]|uniref:Uncharacterized protein n=1 Tax=Pseudocercospora musae TaxID=113226 RepID=A0A139IGL1_9PEZI|nr:hypothetical protein AC579_6902 [Pseudocercospora musae]
MSSTSNVGDRRAYENADQRNYTDDEIAQMKKENRFHEGKNNSHQANDSKDERTIANKLAREEQREKEAEEEKTQEDKERKIDPTLPAKNHGNEPSKGAKLDKELQEEEEELLKKKGNFGPKAAN